MVDTREATHWRATLQLRHLRKDIRATRQRSSTQDRSPANQAIHMQTRRLRQAIHSAWQPQGTLPNLHLVTSMLTVDSHIRTSSMRLLSATSRRSLRPSPRETTYPRKTRSCGSTSRRCTRTPTRVSRAEARTDASLPCHRLHPHTPHHTPVCQWFPCQGVTPDRSISKAATAAAAARPCLLTRCTESTVHTTSVPQCRTHTTSSQAPDTTTWSFPSASSTKIRHKSESVCVHRPGRLGETDRSFGCRRW